MNEAEIQERLRQIRERQALNLPVADRLDGWYAEAVRDIDFLLSLLEPKPRARMGGPLSDLLLEPKPKARAAG